RLFACPTSIGQADSPCLCERLSASFQHIGIGNLASRPDARRSSSRLRTPSRAGAVQRAGQTPLKSRERLGNLPQISAHLYLLCTRQRALQLTILLDKQVHHLGQAGNECISAEPRAAATLWRWRFGSALGLARPRWQPTTRRGRDSSSYSCRLCCHDSSSGSI